MAARSLTVASLSRPLKFSRSKRLIPSQLRALLQMDTRCRGKLASHGIVVLGENEEMTVEYLGAVGQSVGRARSAAACPLGG